MKKLHWTGALTNISMIDPVDPTDPTDNVTQAFFGHANSEFWTGDPAGAYLIGTAQSDLVFLDNDAFTDPRLRDISVFKVGAGDDVVDLSSDRFTYAHVKIVGGTGNDWLFGNAARDRILGGEGTDRMKGNAGSDILIGGDGKDEMFGGGGRDIFIVDAKDGNDNVYDFVARGRQHDVLDISQAPGIDDFNELLAHHALMENGELKITFDDGNYVRLYGLDISDLIAEDFIF